jgi:hypothetical protein
LAIINQSSFGHDVFVCGKDSQPMILGEANLLEPSKSRIAPVLNEKELKKYWIDFKTGELKEDRTLEEALETVKPKKN